MRLLIDTQVLLWAIYPPERLSPRWQTRLCDRSNAVFFSAASVAEIALKSSLNQADFDFDPDEAARAARASDFEELPLTAAHAVRLGTLPWHHRDPFDRLLVAQALEEGLRLLTAERALAVYSDLVELM